MTSTEFGSGGHAGSIATEASMLRMVPFFADVEPAKLKLLAYASERLDFDAGAMVFEEGSNSDDVYFILDGEAEVLAGAVESPVIVATLPVHSLFGEISALCEVPRTASVRASGPLSVLRIPGSAFVGLIEESPALALKVVRELASRLARTTRDLARTRAG